MDRPATSIRRLEVGYLRVRHAFRGKPTSCIASHHAGLPVEIDRGDQSILLMPAANVIAMRGVRRAIPVAKN
jgi:hypothetical protein